MFIHFTALSLIVGRFLFFKQNLPKNVILNTVKAHNFFFFFTIKFKTFINLYVKSHNDLNWPIKSFKHLKLGFDTKTVDLSTLIKLKYIRKIMTNGI